MKPLRRFLDRNHERRQQPRPSISAALQRAEKTEADILAMRAYVKEFEKRAETYWELLYAVGNKYPGESRHDTALRYIRRAEQSSGDSAANLE